MGGNKTAARVSDTSDGHPVSESTYSKDTKHSEYHNISFSVSDTSRRTYSAIQELRQTEIRRARRFFYEHPNGSYSRADLCERLSLPINHICRIVFDLLNEGYIEASGDGINPRTGRNVEYLKLVSHE